MIGSVDRYWPSQEPHRVNTGSVPVIQVLSPWVKIPGCLTSQGSAEEQADSEKGIDWVGLATPGMCLDNHGLFFSVSSMGGRVKMEWNRLANFSLGNTCKEVL